MCVLGTHSSQWNSEYKNNSWSRWCNQSLSLAYFFFKTRFHSVSLVGLWYSLCKPGYPQTDPPASASQVLGMVPCEEWCGLTKVFAAVLLALQKLDIGLLVELTRHPWCLRQLLSRVEQYFWTSALRIEAVFRNEGSCFPAGILLFSSP